MSGPTFMLLGDAALVVGTSLARELSADLRARPLPGVRESVPALNLLTVLFDPLHPDCDALEEALRARLAGLHPRAQGGGRTLVVPVTFGTDVGPDLAWCAAHTQRTEAEFIAALCGLTLEVAFLGFTPGFAFLTGLPQELRMPRLAAPRERVPPGSVALGGPWAGVYPRATPGGWRIVGHTAMKFFDLSQPEPVPWQPGDRVRFEALP